MCWQFMKRCNIDTFFGLWIVGWLLRAEKTHKKRRPNGTSLILNNHVTKCLDGGYFYLFLRTLWISYIFCSVLFRFCSVLFSSVLFCSQFIVYVCHLSKQSGQFIYYCYYYSLLIIVVYCLLRYLCEFCDRLVSLLNLFIVELLSSSRVFFPHFINNISAGHFLMVKADWKAHKSEIHFRIMHT